MGRGNEKAGSQRSESRPWVKEVTGTWEVVDGGLGAGQGTSLGVFPLRGCYAAVSPGGQPQSWQPQLGGETGVKWWMNELERYSGPSWDVMTDSLSLPVKAENPGHL